MPKFLDVPEFYSKNGILTEPTAYDVVIRTQDDWNTMVASSNWLGAKSVLIDGANISIPENGIEIPSSVYIINGMNNAGFSMSSYGGMIKGIYYAEKRTIIDYPPFFGNLRIFISGTPTSWMGLQNITNIFNCTVVGSALQNYATGTLFSNCDHIYNCSVSFSTFYGCQGMFNCTDIEGCYLLIYSSSSTSIGSIYAITDCDRVNNCAVKIYGGTSTSQAYTTSNFLNNCSGEVDVSTGSAVQGSVFYSCRGLSNCTASIALRTQLQSGAFVKCSFLTNCAYQQGTAQSGGTVYGFYNCSYCSCCGKGDSTGSFTNSTLWGGTKTKVDTDSCQDS